MPRLFSLSGFGKKDFDGRTSFFELFTSYSPFFFFFSTVRIGLRLVFGPKKREKIEPNVFLFRYG